MATDLPTFLLKLATGEDIDVSGVTDVSLKVLLRETLGSLRPFGVTTASGNPNAYIWPPGKQTRKTTASSAMALLRIVDSLLDEAGVTLGAVAEYEMAERSKIAQEQQNKRVQQAAQAKTDRTRGLLLKMLVDFGAELGEELRGMLNMVLEGEVVVVSGIDNEQLRERLSAMLESSGLVLDDTEDGERGYSVPPRDALATKALITTLTASCDAADPQSSLDEMRARAGGGGMMMPRGPSMGGGAVGDEDDDESEDEYAVTVGAVAKRPKLTQEEVKNAAIMRNHEMLVAKGLADASDNPLNTGGREEWMMVPGEHDFMSGLAASGKADKSRGFKNEKTNENQELKRPEPRVDPEQAREMEELRKQHDAARGPSLMDAHRAKTQTAKEEKKKAAGGKYGWSRDKDLDSDRKVDKNNLKSLMNGAAGLNDKFASTGASRM